MTLPDVYRQFRYWEKHPPPHRAWEIWLRAHKWEPPITMEEALAQGAMGPEDFFQHFKRTGGRVAES